MQLFSVWLPLIAQLRVPPCCTPGLNTMAENILIGRPCVVSPGSVGGTQLVSACELFLVLFFFVIFVVVWIIILRPWGIRFSVTQAGNLLSLPH